MDASRKHNVAEALGKARALLKDCQVQGVPIDLARLAKQVGIKQVTELNTRLDGQLLELPAGGYEVILSKLAPATRKRFTLAHEIAHLLLFPREAECHLRRETEELCNVAASELLIPERFLTRVLAADPVVSIQSLLRVSRLFRCSLEAAGWKILNSGLVSGALLMWKIADEAEGEFLELVAVPHTWGSQRVVDQGLRVYPENWLWDTVMNAVEGRICFPSTRAGLCYRGDFVRLRRIILIFVGDELHPADREDSGQSRAQPGAPKVNAVQKMTRGLRSLRR
ncbi:MAG: ImmA/IrrE family metallo-endopeptidase [Candidatus Binatia bacterium]